ncbi:hypothetical protein [Cysteiniphilum halobium]|nr:hypothetical protein [Cysteiniphilum halobium]
MKNSIIKIATALFFLCGMSFVAAQVICVPSGSGDPDDMICYNT